MRSGHSLTIPGLSEGLLVTPGLEPACSLRGLLLDGLIHSPLISLQTLSFLLKLRRTYGCIVTEIIWCLFGTPEEMFLHFVHVLNLQTLFE